MKFQKFNMCLLNKLDPKEEVEEDTQPCYLK